VAAIRRNAPVAPGERRYLAGVGDRVGDEKALEDQLGSRGAGTDET